MADLRLPGIPSITPVADQTIASILRPMKESLEIIATSLYGVPSNSGSTNTAAYQYYQNLGTGGSSTASIDPTTVFVYDYTPPPAPTNLSISGAFTNIILSWDAIPTSYTNHAYTEIWRASTNAIGAASLLGFAPGLVYVDAVSTNATYYYWIRFVSTSKIKGGYNGILGTQGTTGKVGTSDLSDAIITANKIATGAIDLSSALVTGLLPNSNLATLADSSKFAANVITSNAIASGAISVTKFASGLEPVTIVTGSLPTVKSTYSIYYNGKLYRWDGTAYVAAVATTDLTGQITTTQITDNAITAAKIAANTITASQIAANTITAAQIAAGTITAAQIAAGAITASELAANSVTAGKIATNAIVANDGVIANLAIGSAQIQDAAIVSAKIGTAAVGSAAIADLAVTNAKIANLAVDSAKIADLAVGTAKIADAAITNAKINDLDASKITAGYISAARIAANSITASMIDSRNLSIKDAAGNIILASGTNLAASYITPSSGWLNSNISIGADGALSGAGGGQVTIAGLGYTGALDATKNAVYRQATTPTGGTYSTNDLWVNTGVNPITIYQWTGSAWTAIGTNTTNTNQLTDGANLGGTALWSGVTGTGKPEDSATKNTIYRQGTAPASPTANDIWMDTTNFAIYYWDGTTWVLAGDKTSSNTALGIVGQGAFATLSQITSTNVSTYIASAAIGNAQIGGTISSTDYVSGSAGWAINKAGAAEFNNATFRGTLNVQSAASGARTVITNSVIKVYDASNIVRVQIGDLTA